MTFLLILLALIFWPITLYLCGIAISLVATAAIIIVPLALCVFLFSEYGTAISAGAFLMIAPFMAAWSVTSYKNIGSKISLEMDPRDINLYVSILYGLTVSFLILTMHEDVYFKREDDFTADVFVDGLFISAAHLFLLYWTKTFPWREAVGLKGQSENNSPEVLPALFDTEHLARLKAKHGERLVDEHLEERKRRDEAEAYRAWERSVPIARKAFVAKFHHDIEPYLNALNSELKQVGSYLAIGRQKSNGLTEPASYEIRVFVPGTNDFSFINCALSSVERSWVVKFQYKTNDKQPKFEKSMLAVDDLTVANVTQIMKQFISTTVFPVTEDE